MNNQEELIFTKGKGFNPNPKMVVKASVLSFQINNLEAILKCFEHGFINEYEYIDIIRDIDSERYDTNQIDSKRQELTKLGFPASINYPMAIFDSILDIDEIADSLGADRIDVLRMLTVCRNVVEEPEADRFVADIKISIAAIKSQLKQVRRKIKGKS